MFRFVRIMTLVALALTVGGSVGAASAKASTFTVNVVVQTEDGAAIAAGQVCVTGPATNVCQDIPAGAPSGREFAFDGFPNGAYDIDVNVDPYLEAVDHAAVADANVTVTFTLQMEHTAQPAEATPVSVGQTTEFDVAGASAFCKRQGGVVRERYPVWGTNLPADQWVQTGDSKLFCEFVHGAGSDDDSGIQMDLGSFASTLPRLATVAYLAQVPLPGNLPHDGSNPATFYCASLGGTQLWGGADTANGGGWVTLDTDTAYQIMDACVFADGSMISAWGLTYHADGTIRGADLQQLLAYQPATLPAFFP